MDFSNRIKELCKARGILVKDLAEKLGITPVGLSKAINQPYPQLQTLERIADALGVDVADLFRPAGESARLTCPHCGAPIEISLK